MSARRDTIENSSLIALQSAGVCYPAPARNASGSGLADLRSSRYRGTIERSNRAAWRAGSGSFIDECGIVSSPDLQLREDHAARRGGDRPRLRGQDHAGQPALRPRARPLQGRRWPTARRSRSPAPRKPRCFAKSRRIPRKPQLTFVNIRETGGWSNDAAAAGPKAAALIAAAQEDMPPISLVTLESSGVALIYGRDEIAIEAAQRLADRLDITVLLTRPGDVIPRRTQRVPGAQGHHPQRQRPSRRVRACDRRLCAAAALLARQTACSDLRAMAPPRPAT